MFGKAPETVIKNRPQTPIACERLAPLATLPGLKWLYLNDEQQGNYHVQ